MKTWVCDDPAKGDKLKLRKGRPLESLCPGVVGTPNTIWDSNRQENKMFGISDAKNKCTCECHLKG